MSRSRLSVHALAVAGVASAVAACGHIPVASMIQLSRIDFQATDPAQLRAAVRLPQAVQPREVALRIAVKVRADAMETQEYVLRDVTDSAELAALTREAGAGTHVFAYRLDQSDVARITAFRAALIQKKDANVRGAITISVRPQGCTTEPLPAGPVYFSSFLRTIETGGYVTLARDADLRTIVPDRDVAAEIPRC